MYRVELLIQRLTHFPFYSKQLLQIFPFLVHQATLFAFCTTSNMIIIICRVGVLLHMYLSAKNFAKLSTISFHYLNAIGKRLVPSSIRSAFASNLPLSQLRNLNINQVIPIAFQYRNELVAHFANQLVERCVNDVNKL